MIAWLWLYRGAMAKKNGTANIDEIENWPINRWGRQVRREAERNS